MLKHTGEQEVELLWDSEKYYLVNVELGRESFRMLVLKV